MISEELVSTHNRIKEIYCYADLKTKTYLEHIRYLSGELGDRRTGILSESKTAVDHTSRTGTRTANTDTYPSHTYINRYLGYLRISSQYARIKQQPHCHKPPPNRHYNTHRNT